MAKGKEVTGILIIAVVLAAVFAGMMYNKSTQLSAENDKLQSDVAALNSEKNSVIGERDACRSDAKNLQSELGLLQQDVADIYKTCITNNICKGHYPGVRWFCNNVGDQADASIASHTCECDSSCNLNATALIK